MIYLALQPPAQWRAGLAGDRPFFFDCADCAAKEPPIAGLIAAVAPDAPIPMGLGIQDVAILTDAPRGPRHAMFCAVCFQKRLSTLNSPTRPNRT